MKDEHIVIGLGEVGKAIKEVIGCTGYDVITKNVKVISKRGVKFMHICFPYSKDFSSEVKRYQKLFSPTYTVVHSTVPIGTCDKLKVVHAPVRGRHPKIAESLKIFPMYVGGRDSNDVAYELQNFGIPACPWKSARDTEAFKLWDTTQYGVMILLNKEIKKFCNIHNLDFCLVYREGNNSYNYGYDRLDMPQVSRPYLDYVEGRIGGHCVVQNARLLNSASARRILKEEK